MVFDSGIGVDVGVTIAIHIHGQTRHAIRDDAKLAARILLTDPLDQSIHTGQHSVQRGMHCFIATGFTGRLDAQAAAIPDETRMTPWIRDVGEQAVEQTVDGIRPTDDRNSIGSYHLNHDDINDCNGYASSIAMRETIGQIDIRQRCAYALTGCCQPCRHFGNRARHLQEISRLCHAVDCI